MSLENWKNEVVCLLANEFENDPDTFSRVMYYLDEEEKTYQNCSSPLWRTLKCSMHKKELFKSYAKRISEDTKKAEKDVCFKNKMCQVYENMVEISENPTDIDDFQSFDMKAFFEKSAIEKAGLIGFASAWTIVPIKYQNEIMNFMETLITNKAIMMSMNNAVGLVNKYGGKVVRTTLAAVTLAYDVVKSIFRWWNGEISGHRCCKNIVDSLCTTVASVVGGISGAAIGTLLGPAGTVVGGIIGGIISASAANALSDRMTQRLFGVPKDEALENAFRFFNLDVRASNHEINTAYRKMCLLHHPDKGGNSKDFHYVQVNMAIIKAAKGDLQEL
nr:uncharacterized protein LOC105847351 [Hydra vulgaris]